MRAASGTAAVGTGDRPPRAADLFQRWPAPRPTYLIFVPNVHCSHCGVARHCRDIPLRAEGCDADWRRRCSRLREVTNDLIGPAKTRLDWVIVLSLCGTTSRPLALWASIGRSGGGTTFVTVTVVIQRHPLGRPTGRGWRGGGGADRRARRLRCTCSIGVPSVLLWLSTIDLLAAGIRRLAGDALADRAEMVLLCACAMVFHRLGDHDQL